MNQPDHNWSRCNHLALVAAITGVLMARLPNLWTTGEFIAEDGRVFFADAWNHSLPLSLLLPYAGYFHVLPRLAAELLQPFPLAWQPTLYAFVGLLANAALLTVFYLPSCRNLLPSDPWRLAVCLLLSLAPNAENLGLLLGWHWYLTAVFALLLVMEFPAGRWPRRTLMAAAVAIPWSAPAALALTPFFLWRLLLEKKAAVRMWLGIALLNLSVTGGYLLVFRLSNPERTGAFTLDMLPPALERLFLRGWLAETGIGHRLAGTLAAQAPALLSLIGLLVLGVFAFSLWRHRGQPEARAAVLLLLAAAAMLFLSLARTLYLAELAGRPLPRHTRYLTAPSLLLIIAGSITLFLGRTRMPRWGPTLVFAAVAGFQLFGFTQTRHWSRPPGYFNWNDWIPAIRAFSQSQHREPASLYLPSDVPYDGPVLERLGGLLVMPEAGLPQALQATPVGPELWQSWIGAFQTKPGEPWILHEDWGPLEFLGVYGGRVWFRDYEERLHFTSQLLYPDRWIVDEERFILDSRRQRE